MEANTPDQDFDFVIVHQQSYSRGQLLLRTFFGFIYIVIPHAFILAFLSIAGVVLSFISWWAILFTARYPKSFFDFQVSLLRWRTRVAARILNLADGYPAFGMSVADDKVMLNLAYPARLSRGILLLRLFFGTLYIIIPHGICLVFRVIANYVLIFIAWWAVLITGRYPPGMHNFVVGTLRWALRVNVYFTFLTDKYPPFSGKK